MVGRPLKYKTASELQSAIDAWFDSFKEIKGLYPTMSGLAYHLGFTDRQSLYDYKGREEFSCTIKRALLRIESLHENNLYGTSPTGSIFWLKNRDWRDKTETDLTTKGEKIQGSPIIASNPQGKPPDEL
jgi:hypothetical protein